MEFIQQGLISCVQSTFTTLGRGYQGMSRQSSRHFECYWSQSQREKEEISLLGRTGPIPVCPNRQKEGESMSQRGRKNYVYMASSNDFHTLLFWGSFKSFKTQLKCFYVS